MGAPIFFYQVCSAWRSFGDAGFQPGGSLAFAVHLQNMDMVCEAIDERTEEKHGLVKTRLRTGFLCQSARSTFITSITVKCSTSYVHQAIQRGA
jgi:hypothetical protein